MTRPPGPPPSPGLRGPVPIFAALDTPRETWEADPDGCKAELRARLQRVAGTIVPPYRVVGEPRFTTERPAWDHCHPKRGWVTIYGRALGEPTP